MNKFYDDATIEWLLEEENPSVRYLTLTQILNKSEKDNEVIEARKKIMQCGIVPKILDAQNIDGYWGDPKRFYIDKYRGTVWQLLILAELKASGNNDKIKKAAEFILNNSQDTESYGFSINKSAKAGGRYSGVIPCLTGNMVYSLINLGYLDDKRIEKSIEWICQHQRCDDGVQNLPKDWPYDKLEMCFGKHSCHMGVVKALKALTSIPEEKRYNNVKNKINELVEYILIHHIFKKSHDLNKVSKPGWLKLGFPLMYQTDILEILEILTDLGIRDNRMEEAITVLKNKQGKNKRWKLENTFNGKMIENIEEIHKDSKWITLKALKILANYYKNSN